MQDRAKRQAFTDTGCEAPWKVTHSSLDSVGRTARGGPDLLVPPESSVTLVAIAVEPAAPEVVEESVVLVRQRGPLIEAPEDGFVNLSASHECLPSCVGVFFRGLRSSVRRSDICIRFWYASEAFSSSKARMKRWIASAGCAALRIGC